MMAQIAKYLVATISFTESFQAQHAVFS